jgi:hypothetical protein
VKPVTINKLKRTMAQLESEIKRVQLMKDGNVVVTSEPLISEQEIVEERADIIYLMHAAYLQLCDEMAGFQNEWTTHGMKSMMYSARDGLQGGSAEWVDDQAAFFDKKTWTDFGDKVADFAVGTRDTMSVYAEEQLNDMQRAFEAHAANPGATILNWNWWSGLASDKFNAEVKNVKTAIHQLEEAGNAVIGTIETAKKIYKYSDAILNLPNLLASGDAIAVQSFVENELMDIDKELAMSIRWDPNFPVILEIINDHESVLTYLAYVGLMVEAIPPNFYAYVAGKGAAYLIIEVIMLVITALLSAGAAAGARIAALVVRLTAASARVAGMSRKVAHAKAAVASFIRALNAVNRAVDELHTLGGKLLLARTRPLKLSGGSKTTLTAKKECIKRNKRCRICGSTKHRTPIGNLGYVTYK